MESSPWAARGLWDRVVSSTLISEEVFMRKKLTIIALALVLGGGTLARDAAAQCQVCYSDCAGEETHTNEATGFVGNPDDPHPCWGYSCLYMQEHGVHELNCYGGFAAAAFEE